MVDIRLEAPKILHVRMAHLRHACSVVGHVVQCILILDVDDEGTATKIAVGGAVASILTLALGGRASVTMRIDLILIGLQ